MDSTQLIVRERRDLLTSPRAEEATTIEHCIEQHRDTLTETHGNTAHYARHHLDTLCGLVRAQCGCGGGCSGGQEGLSRRIGAGRTLGRMLYRGL